MINYHFNLLTLMINFNKQINKIYKIYKNQNKLNNNNKKLIKLMIIYKM